MSTDTNQELESTIREIRRAFHDVSRGDGITFHEALVIDDYGSDSERVAARALDLDRHWKDVPDQLIAENDSVLCFVDPKGFRYYLPAYMISSLQNYETSETYSHNHPVCSLELSEHGGIRRWQLERFEVFNEAQAKSICRFLRFMADREEDFVDVRVARAALDAYWGRFCESRA